MLFRSFQVSRNKTVKLLLVSIGFNDLLVGSDLLGNLGVLENIGLGLGDLSLGLVESFSLDLPLGFQSSNDVLVLPANLKTIKSIKEMHQVGKSLRLKGCK